jgi:hypothetical protein
MKKPVRRNQWIVVIATCGIAGLAPMAQADSNTNVPAAATAAAAATNAPAGTAAPPASQPYGKKANEWFLRRLNEAFMEQMGTPCYSPPDTNAPPSPTRRIGNPPFDSPPYPDGDWQIGGGPNVIGDPGALRDSPYPLMQAIYDGPDGKPWYDSRIQFYGWVTVSGNLSTSHNEGLNHSLETANYPEVYDERPDRLELDQAVLYIERMPDQNQTDHIDWGFRIACLEGLDYRFMASRGYLNDNNLFRDNKFTGFDTPMLYLQVYVPQVAEGMSILLGRIISMPDIEQQLAPNNLMASHSLVYSFDNYTMWGLWTSTKLNANWVLQLSIADGVDIAPWATEDPGDQPTGSVMVQYIAPNGKDSFYVGMNSFNNGQFGFNNLQECIESYTHKFNELWWTTFEAQYMWTHGCSTVPTKSVPIEDGFYPVKPGYAYTAGLVNYTMRRVAPNVFITFRNEIWDDPSGYRSGYSSCYTEHSIGFQWWPNKLIMVRPEIRFEHCWTDDGLASSSAAFNSTGAPARFKGAYDNGTRDSQLTAAVDVTWHF